MSGWRAELQRRFGQRVSFDANERLVYSHDMATMPGTVEKIVRSVPEAVVQPKETEEIIDLMRIAAEANLPLVPRGNATSGYGGCIPTNGGIVVDFSLMNRVVLIDEDNLTVTVEPGVVWTDLAAQLQEAGLALRLYPTSAPGSTVAGWVAEGGAGIGSYAYGMIGDNLEEVQHVTPAGRVEKRQGGDLEAIVGSEGILGFIVSVTLKVQPANKEIPCLVQFNGVEEAAACLQQVGWANLPIWHVGVQNAVFVGRTQQALKQIALPLDKCLVLFVYQAHNQDLVEGKLTNLVKASGGVILDSRQALHVWAERYYPMRFKRLGPSLIPGEAVIPLANFAATARELMSKIPGLAFEGMMAGPNEVVLLGFILSDERTTAFTIEFSKSLLMLDIARKHGGRPYSVGMMLTDRSRERFGEAKLAQMAQLKAKTDPKKILNPGKIFPGQHKTLSVLMQLGKLAQPFTPIAEKVVSHTPKENPKIPAAIAREAYYCAQCGYCKNVCTLYAGKSWESATPRGKWYLLKKYLAGEIELNQDLIDNFLLCTTCKRCDEVCQVNIPIQETWDELRGVLIQDKQQPTFPAFEMMGASVSAERNIWANKMERRDNWVPADVTYQPAGAIGYWAGCTASLVETEIARNAVRILKEGGVDFTYLAEDEACCGAPMFMAGKWDVFAQIVRHNVAEIKKRGIKTMVVSCPGCWVQLAHNYRHWAEKLGLDYDIEVKHISEMAQELLADGRLRFKEAVPETVTWHDSCHIGRHGGIYNPPREVLKAIPGLNLVEMKHNREQGLCCGSVLTRIGAPQASDKIADVRLKEAAEAGATTVLSTCPCCEVQLRVGGQNVGSPMNIQDFSTYVVKGLGYETPDSTQSVLDLWVVFDAMINVMTVEAMVDMMKELMPQMLKAMPDLMKSMVNMAKVLPGPVEDGMFKVMQRMIPLMMPSMMPAMMPKVLPDILAYIEKKVPSIPSDMKEMMPDMMPKVMDRLMPAMLPPMARALAPYMIATIQKAEAV